jgi:hypothetical protein
MALILESNEQKFPGGQKLSNISLEVPTEVADEYEHLETIEINILPSSERRSPYSG